MDDHDLWRQLATDVELRARFVADPRKALAEHGRAVPDGVEVTVLEQTPQQAYIVLPAVVSDELSDDELDGAAGGYRRPRVDIRGTIPPSMAQRTVVSPFLM